MRAHQPFNTLAFKSRSRALCAALALAAGAGFASSAATQPYAGDDQPYVGEIVVSGIFGPYGNPTRLSRTISLRDLDLANRQDQQVLRLRIRDTARDLCRALGEEPGTGGASPIVPSCQTQAVRDARQQLRTAIAQADDRARFASLDRR
jgi:UrcA family protein